MLNLIVRLPVLTTTMMIILFVIHVYSPAHNVLPLLPARLVPMEPTFILIPPHVCLPAL